MKKFINKLDNNTIAWFLASAFITFIFCKNWMQGTFAISYQTQIVAYILGIIFTKKAYKFILDM